MRYYIASGLANFEQVRWLKARLDAAGWTHTYDWTVHGSVQREGIGRIGEVADAEIEGVLTADIVIVLLPGGRGTHTELGAAIAAPRTGVARIVIYSPTGDDFARDGNTCAFYFHPAVERFSGSLAGIIDGLLSGEI